MYTSVVGLFSFSFFNVPATTDIYTLSLHDALPISRMFGANISWLKLTCTVSLFFFRSTTTCTFHKLDRKSTRLNSSHTVISYAVFCLKKKKKTLHDTHQLRDHQAADDLARTPSQPA